MAVMGAPSPSAAVLAAGLEDELEMIVKERQVFSMGPHTTVGGGYIPDVKINWESYGELGYAKDNVILITHFMLTFGHAAGRYDRDERFPGFWDALIGPGKAIDTRRYFVICADTLCSLYAGHPKVTTTGPASIDPRTGKPYGLSFPLITIPDIVDVQKALIRSLGIRKLKAVIGASMGAAQAYEWAVRYPDMVERIVPVGGAAAIDPWQVAWMNTWMTPIRIDPDWNGGDYYGHRPPLRGLHEAMKIGYINTRHWLQTNEMFGRNWADLRVNPAERIDGRFRVEDALDAVADRRCRYADANHFLYLVKANQAFQAGWPLPLEEAIARIKARVLAIYSPHDHVYTQPSVRRTIEMLMAAGVRLKVIERPDTFGHADTIINMAPMADPIRAFLAT